MTKNGSTQRTMKRLETVDQELKRIAKIDKVLSKRLKQIYKAMKSIGM